MIKTLYFVKPWGITTIDEFYDDKGNLIGAEKGHTICWYELRK